jgi:hypothetical protein
MATKETEARIREARLIVADPEVVYADLKKYGESLKGMHWSDYEDYAELEKSLLKRDDPLINLGLAQYAFETEVISSLYEKSLAKPENDQLGNI